MEMITDRTTPVAKFSTCIFVINRSSKVVRLQDTQVGVVEKKKPLDFMVLLNPLQSHKFSKISYQDCHAKRNKACS